MTVAFLVLLASLSTTYSQEQEAKLIDRLLKPDTTLVNPAQNKKFAAAGKVENKTIPTKTFSAPEKARAKTFSTTRNLTPREFAARHFRAGHTAADISARSQITKSDTIYPVPSPYPTRVAAGSSSTAPSSSTFAGTRPFLVEGKSQKALRAHDKPLTVEQVRELLNKNK